MTALGVSLNLQHRDLEDLLDGALNAARAADWPGYRLCLLAARGALGEHMAYEEEELFPQLERGGFAAAELDALRDEHEQLRRELDTLGAAAPQHDPAGCIGELEELARLQREHHARETAACYAHAEGVAAPQLPKLAATARALDLRGLQPPEPIVRIFEALERSPHAPLRAILPHEPVPLYGLLRERGFAYTGAPRPDGSFEVLIERG